MGTCQICHKTESVISNQFGVCQKCIKQMPEQALKITDRIHEKSRAQFDLPAKPPKHKNGISCGVCANDCKIGLAQKGYCGLVENVNGQLVRHGGTSRNGILEWYYDPLPTNCVAWWFCPGCTGAGYPEYSYKQGAETGYVNLAVFYGSCSYDCLFCQNWHYRRLAQKHQPSMSAEKLAEKVDERVACVCFFGGDPSTQMPHALKASQMAVEKAEKKKRILRICWETNGNMKRKFAKKVAEFSLQTGGVVKFDLKTWNENLHKALCGISNKSALQNFQMIGEEYFPQRLELPVLAASTLLIPGYVDVEEVENIAGFIAEINPKIPYTLLAFYPNYVMDDLPTTSRKQAYECYETAKKHLENVRIGNLRLLSI